jgi:hypothetical protein
MFDMLPHALSQRYTRSQYRDAVLQHNIEHNIGYDELPACAFDNVEFQPSSAPSSSSHTNRVQPNRLTQHHYLELFMRTALARLQLYPYRHVHSVITYTRETPLTYYTVMLGLMLYREQRYDLLPNFTAIDILNLLGVGRNQFLELSKQVRTAKLTVSALEAGGKDRGITGVVGGLGKAGRWLMGQRAAGQSDKHTDPQQPQQPSISTRTGGRVHPLYALPSMVSNAIYIMQQQYLPSHLVETNLLQPFYVVRVVPGTQPEDVRKILRSSGERALYDFLTHYEECVSSTIAEAGLPQAPADTYAPIEVQLAQLADQRPAITFTALYEAFLAETKPNHRRGPRVEGGESMATRSSSSRDLAAKADDSSDSNAPTPVPSERIISSSRQIGQSRDAVSGRFLSLVRERLQQQRWVFDNLLAHACPYSPSGSAILHGDENQIAPITPYFYAAELPFLDVNTLHQRGMLYSAFVVERTERIHVPPLERFVMNRTTSDPQEALLYKVLSTTDRDTSMSMLAQLLRLPIDGLCSAAMMYERLGLAQRIGTSVGGVKSELASDRSADEFVSDTPLPPCDVIEGKHLHDKLLLSLGGSLGGVPVGFLPLVTTPTSTHLAELAMMEPRLGPIIAPFRFPMSVPHESWDQVGGKTVAIAGHRLQDLKRRHVLSRIGLPAHSPTSSTLNSSQFCSLEEGGPKKRIALLYDSAVAGVLMMTNLSTDPTFKQHAVTLFEAGKLSFDMLHAFEQKLSLVEVPEEMKKAGMGATGMFDAVFALRDVLGVLRQVTIAHGDEEGPTGVDMLKVESVNELPAETRYSILCRNYSTFFVLTPLSAAVPLLDVALENVYGPTVSTQTNSPWCLMYLHSRLYLHTTQPLPPMWMAPAGLRVRRLPQDLALGGVRRGNSFRPKDGLFTRRTVQPKHVGALLSLFGGPPITIDPAVDMEGPMWDTLLGNKAAVTVSTTVALRCCGMAVEPSRGGGWESRSRSDDDLLSEDHSHALLLDPFTCLPAVNEQLARAATLFIRVPGVPRTIPREHHDDTLPLNATEEDEMLHKWVIVPHVSTKRFTFPSDQSAPRTLFPDVFMGRSAVSGVMGRSLSRSEPLWVASFEVQMPFHTAVAGDLDATTANVALYIGLHLAERRAEVCKQIASTQPTATFGSAGRKHGRTRSSGVLERLCLEGSILRESAPKSSLGDTILERRLSVSPTLRPQDQSLLHSLEEKSILVGTETQVSKILDNISLCAASCEGVASLLVDTVAQLRLSNSLGAATVRFAIVSSVVAEVKTEPLLSAETLLHCEVLDPCIVDITLGLITNDRRVCRDQLSQFAGTLDITAQPSGLFAEARMAAHSKSMEAIGTALETFTATLRAGVPSDEVPTSRSPFTGIACKGLHSDTSLYLLQTGILTDSPSTLEPTSALTDTEASPRTSRASRLPLLTCDTIQRNAMHLRAQLGDPLLGLPQPATESIFIPY